MTTCSPVIERSRVVLRPIRSTVPVRLVVADRVAALERLVEQDRERREQVGENALRGEADGDAADAEAGDQRGDVHAEIVEDEDDGDREQGDADQHADDRHRVAERARAVLLADPAADHAEDQLARPDRALKREGDDEAGCRSAARPCAAARRRSRRCRARRATMNTMLVLASTRPITVAPAASRRDRRATMRSPKPRSDEHDGDDRDRDDERRSAARRDWRRTSRELIRPHASRLGGGRRAQSSGG